MEHWRRKTEREKRRRMKEIEFLKLYICHSRIIRFDSIVSFIFHFTCLFFFLSSSDERYVKNILGPIISFDLSRQFGRSCCNRFFKVGGEIWFCFTFFFFLKNFRGGEREK